LIIGSKGLGLGLGLTLILKFNLHKKPDIEQKHKKCPKPEIVRSLHIIFAEDQNKKEGSNNYVTVMAVLIIVSVSLLMLLLFSSGAGSSIIWDQPQ